MIDLLALSAAVTFSVSLELDDPLSKILPSKRVFVVSCERRKNSPKMATRLVELVIPINTANIIPMYLALGTS